MEKEGRRRTLGGDSESSYATSSTTCAPIFGGCACGLLLPPVYFLALILLWLIGDWYAEQTHVAPVISCPGHHISEQKFRAYVRSLEGCDVCGGHLVGC